METEIEIQGYNIKTAAFEGPFALLLSLVEEKKLFINDVSLSQVTEDYLNYINKLDKFNPMLVSSFLVVAATLILIKSKSLLPNLDLTNEEKSDISSLEERLRLYEIFNKLGLHIKENFGQKIIFPPLERKTLNIVFLSDVEITKDSMMTFAASALGRMPKKVFLPEVEVKKVISIEEMIDRLTDRIKNSLKMNFADFAGRAVTKEERVVVIVGFLAMLELVRQGILNAFQQEGEADIFIEKLEIIEENI